jgi:predicted nucleic acid-binding protein
MTHGLDTGFLVALEHLEHPDHADAEMKLAGLIASGDRIAVAPQVLSEFLHVVTDPRRFVKPIDMVTARQVAEKWWTAAEVIPVFPDDAATRQFLTWVGQHNLGRKRLLDTLLAATLREAAVFSILTTNPSDFTIFGIFTCITPSSAPSPGPLPP